MTAEAEPSLAKGAESFRVTELDEEVMLVNKTTQDNFEKVREVITDLHTYEVPEIIMFPVAEGSAPFLDWIRTSVNRLV